MRKLGLLLTLTVVGTLSACADQVPASVTPGQGKQSEQPIKTEKPTETPYVIPVMVSPLAESIGGTEDLKVQLQVVNSSCSWYREITVLERTPTKLSLQVNGVHKAPCQAVPSAALHTLEYIDHGNPARTGNFEVVVNGKSYGKIPVR